MMQIEFSCYDISSNETEIKELLSQASKFRVDVISVLPAYQKIARSIITESIIISCPIDYPIGILDLKSRAIATENAIKNGAKTIDIVGPSYYLCNRKYDKFREDIRVIKELCDQYSVELRYFLEYRVYSYDLLYKAAQILLENGVLTILPSTGYSLDEINDNILASALINKKIPDINIICNGNIWQEKHVVSAQKAGLYGLRVNSINGLELIAKNQ